MSCASSMPRARYVPGNDLLPGPTAGAVTLRRDVTECICDVNRVRITGVGANLVQVKHFTNRVKSLKLSCLFSSLTFYLSSRQILSFQRPYFFFFLFFLFFFLSFIYFFFSFFNVPSRFRLPICYRPSVLFVRANQTTGFR